LTLLLVEREIVLCDGLTAAPDTESFGGRASTVAKMAAMSADTSLSVWFARPQIQSVDHRRRNSEFEIRKNAIGPGASIGLQ
jgi:hypothetical protein